MTFTRDRLSSLIVSSAIWEEAFEQEVFKLIELETMQVIKPLAPPTRRDSEDEDNTELSLSPVRFRPDHRNSD